MAQNILFKETQTDDLVRHSLGSGLLLEIKGSIAPIVTLRQHGAFMRKVDFADKIAKKIFVIDLVVQYGVPKLEIAKALNMSRQTIYNYLELNHHMGYEGLIHSYQSSESKSIRTQRKLNKDKLYQGNKFEELAEIRKEGKKSEAGKPQTIQLDLDQSDSETEHSYSEIHDWTASRYAGVFTYIISLISTWNWLDLLLKYFGNSYKIFMVFLLMSGRNIRSLEHIKNVRLKEAGKLLGLSRLPSKPLLWGWFWQACRKQKSGLLKKDYFAYQIRKGLVGIWVWFTDGHLLPYTGWQRVRHSFNTQRRMPVPGQTNLVTCDSSGRIVDFDIQEGHGDLKGQILKLAAKWKSQLPDIPIMAFDREGSGTKFYWNLVDHGIPFVTWEKNTKKEILDSISDEWFSDEFEYNGKKYQVFEETKKLSYSEDKTTHEFSLRRIIIWNHSSHRRACGLAWTGNLQIETEECARLILNRWGASENTFKHLSNRHPYHYHPGFTLVESRNQEITNPDIREKEILIKKLKTKLGRLYKRVSKLREVHNKDGSVRQNNAKIKAEQELSLLELQLEKQKQEKNLLPGKVDVSTLENYKSIKRIDNEGKNLFDFVTTSVWNARKQMVDWIKPLYSQDNEIVDLFYAITDCQGWIKSTPEKVVVRLEPLQQPKRRMVQEQLCRKLTGLGARLPIGKKLVIEVGESPI